MRSVVSVGMVVAFHLAGCLGTDEQALAPDPPGAGLTGEGGAPSPRAGLELLDCALAPFLFTLPASTVESALPQEFRANRWVGAVANVNLRVYTCGYAIWAGEESVDHVALAMVTTPVTGPTAWSEGTTHQTYLLEAVASRLELVDHLGRAGLAVRLGSISLSYAGGLTQLSVGVDGSPWYSALGPASERSEAAGAVAREERMFQANGTRMQWLVFNESSQIDGFLDPVNLDAQAGVLRALSPQKEGHLAGAVQKSFAAGLITFGSFERKGDTPI